MTARKTESSVLNLNEGIRLRDVITYILGILDGLELIHSYGVKFVLVLFCMNKVTSKLRKLTLFKGQTKYLEVIQSLTNLSSFRNFPFFFLLPVCSSWIGKQESIIYEARRLQTL